MTDVSFPGDVEIVDDVPDAFADLVVKHAPRSIGLSGGDLARDCYARLRDREPDWSAVDVFIGDERFVTVTDRASNEGMARATLLDAVRPRVIHGMARGDSPVAAAEAYDALVRDSPPIEFLHLGMGPDGHTASLFSGSPALEETQRFVVATGDDLHEHPRVTFTYPAIARCLFVVVTVEGEDKREAIARIRAGDDLPAARIQAADRLLWIGDRAALG